MCLDPPVGIVMSSSKLRRCIHAFAREGAAAELPHRRLELPEFGDQYVAVVSPKPHCRFGKLVPFHWSCPADPGHDVVFCSLEFSGSAVEIVVADHQHLPSGCGSESHPVSFSDPSTMNHVAPVQECVSRVHVLVPLFHQQSVHRVCVGERP